MNMYKEGDATRDNSQRRTMFSATQRCNLIATFFRMVAALFQHCNALLR